MSLLPRVTLICFFLSAGAAGNAQADPEYGQPRMLGGISSLPVLTDAQTRSISAENPTGEKGKGGMAIPNPSELKPAASARAADDLGQGWKVRPFLRVNAGKTVTLMDVEGPGVIQHIWMVENLSRAHVLRFYWDDEDTPSIEVPAPDFFAVGHETFARVNSLAVIVNPRNAVNCYWPMPFRKHARVTFTNEADKDLILLAYQITYALTDVPENAAYFHAQWRRSNTSEQNPYVILDGVRGKGRYAGTFLAWTQLKKGWFGEGEIKFYMDGDEEFPTICGTGTEDYFGGSYGFPESYTTAYLGTTLASDAQDTLPNYWSLYRWHIEDPICYKSDLRITIQALGWGSDRKYQLLSDDIASVAYWYQTEPHAPFPSLPPLEKRGRLELSALYESGFFEAESMKVTKVSAGKTRKQDLRTIGAGWSGAAHLWWTGATPKDTLELAVPVVRSGDYRLSLQFTKSRDYAVVLVYLDAKPLGEPMDLFSVNPAPSGRLDMGVHELREGPHTLKVEIVGANEQAKKSYMVGLDYVLLEEVN